MIALLLSILGIFIVLVISEYGWRRQWLDNEIGRKFVHILVGSFVAFWPYFLSWNQIRLLSIAFVIAVLISNHFKVFRAISSVQRPTYGELFFALTVGVMTFVTHDKAVYAAALLQMSIADGLAAVIGTRYGRDNKYHLLGHNKSVAGTAAFIFASLAILIGFTLLSGTAISPLIIIAAVLTAALLENVAAFGLDNVVVPVFIGLLLARL